MSQLTHNRVLDSQQEARVVALIARGDSYSAIRDQLASEGVEVALSTIGAVKKRNPEALAHIKKIIVADQTTRAQKILNKSRDLIDKKLDRAADIDAEVARLQEAYEAEEITPREYWSALEVVLRQALTITELNSVSKESFNQSQIEANKPTSITESPAQAKENLERLLRAIASKDTSKVLEAILPPTHA